MPDVEQSSQTVAALAADGVDRALLSAIVVAVDDYTIGFTVREATVDDPQHRGAGIAEAMREPHMRALLESGEFPLLSDFIAGGQDLQIEDRFELGLDWLLDGFAAKIGR